MNPEIATPHPSSNSDTRPIQKRANSLQTNDLQDKTKIDEKQNRASSEYENDTSEHEKCATCVQQNSLPDDLGEVVDAWEFLPQEVKSGIVALVNAVLKKPGTEK